jgi:hypothetical protein
MSPKPLSADQKKGEGMYQKNMASPKARVCAPSEVLKAIASGVVLRGDQVQID